LGLGNKAQRKEGLGKKGMPESRKSRMVQPKGKCEKGRTRRPKKTLTGGLEKTQKWGEEEDTLRGDADKVQN